MTGRTGLRGKTQVRKEGMSLVSDNMSLTCLWDIR